MRLVIVSNRLPITVVEKAGKLTFQRGAGGLVSGLSGYLDYLRSSSSTKEYIWVGWPGIAVADEMREELKSRALSEFQAYPVFIPEKSMEEFYHGFCNKIIWPLFHYFPSYAAYDESYWRRYKSVNETFRDAIMKIIKPDDVVWIHDYHLMLLPKLIRERMPDVPIGFFLHTPFPSYEIFRLLPGKWRREILMGLLGADFIGFHTQDYSQYFLRCVLRILGYEHDMGKIIGEGHIVRVDTLPMGIDFKKFHNAVNSPEVQRERYNLKKTLADSKVIFSVDRLDYTKGVINRIRGYEIFLEKNPQWHKKVTFILVLAPSRIGMEHYQRTKKQIDGLVGEINGRFSSIDWTPLLYQYGFLPFYPLIARYSVSDVALITPLRDGMNLVAKEYIATRAEQTGVLILSEMVGASKELGEAIIINPNSREEIAKAIQEALEMPKEEQIRRNTIMQKRLKCYDVIQWAEDFISGVFSVREEQKKFNARLLSTHVKGQLVRDFGKADRRLLFLDYDGTLVPFAGHPEMAGPDEEVLNLLDRLSKYPQIDVVLTSGRDKGTLQRWFGMLNIDYIAEHGAWIKEKGEDWKLTGALATDWKPHLLPILKMYADRVPGSFVEEKEFSIGWHYRRSNPESGSLQARELTDELINFTANIDVQVLQGSKVVEVRNASVNKGVAAMHFISRGSFDFILAIGDDSTDEDLFKMLPGTAYSIRVGMTSSHARFNLRNYVEVRKLIEELIK